MQTLEINKANALKAHRVSNEETKRVLEELFGKETFSEKIKITDRIQTLEDIFELVPPTENQKILLDYNGVDPKMLGAKNFMLGEMIVEAYHEGKVVDHTDSSQRKYEAWYDGSKGFAFGASGYGGWNSGTSCGSRLCWLDVGLMRDAHAKFPEVFRTIVKKY